jgi:hypothetical protein
LWPLRGPAAQLLLPDLLAIIAGDAGDAGDVYPRAPKFAHMTISPTGKILYRDMRIACKQSFG